jgi:signal transduction histidine kinase/DNA-binding NarL/FixJ family response regulator
MAVKRFDAHSKAFRVVLTLEIVAVVGFFDFFTGFELNCFAFYLIPVILAVWFVGRGFGMLVSALCAVVSTAGDLIAGARFSSSLILVWNTAISLAFCLVVVWILAKLRSLHSELEGRVRQRTAALNNEMLERARLEEEILSISEREQRRIGHDLHDSLGQQLTGVALAGQVLSEQLAAKSLPETKSIDHIVEMVEAAIELTRTLARGLHPLELRGEGFTDALEEMAASVTEGFKTRCVFECDLPVAISDPGVAIHLYRIAQEAINNAVKHSKASNIVARLEADEDGVKMTVTDDGVGLPENPPGGKGMGLRIMAHRAGVIGATFHAERVSPRGTRVTCALDKGALPPEHHDRKSQNRLLVDDHPLVREWLANLINLQADLQVCGEADRAPTAMQIIGETNPKIAIVDISMEGGSGIELIKNLKASYPGVMVIVLSMHDEGLYAERALRAGARGYIMKREATKNVLQAIRCVLGGKLYLSDKMAMAMAEKLVDGRPAATPSPVDILSDRELEVFQLLGRGYGTRQIATELHVSIKTIQAFYARIKTKMKLFNAAELLREAVRWHDSQHES